MRKCTRVSGVVREWVRTSGSCQKRRAGGAGRRVGVGDGPRWGWGGSAPPDRASPLVAHTGSRGSCSGEGAVMNGRASVSWQTSKACWTAGEPGQITRCRCRVFERWASSRTTWMPPASMKLSRLRSEHETLGMVRERPADRVPEVRPPSEVALALKLDRRGRPSPIHDDVQGGCCGLWRSGIRGHELALLDVDFSLSWRRHPAHIRTGACHSYPTRPAEHAIHQTAGFTLPPLRASAGLCDRAPTDTSACRLTRTQERH
jgi:hypothetical protein